jgi:opacity protein-like surface antigen
MRNLLCVFLAALAAAAPGYSQNFEIHPFVGAKFGGRLPVSGTTPASPNIATIQLEPSISYGAAAGYNFTGNLAAEFLWSRQPTVALGQLQTGGSESPNVDVNVDQYHGNLLFHFTEPARRFRPYFLIGFGVSHIQGNGSSQTKFSYGLGGGLKYFFNDHTGVRFQARYAPTYLYSTPAGIWCNWWGYCWALRNDHFLNQGDVTAGWIVRF